tara:strand:+ start:1040 stop:1204 length:165 start_codon:yes stop_codon:yes gene_type:complete
MGEENSHPLLSSIIGILALIVVFYRIIFIGYPMFSEGYQKGQISIILKSITTLV